MIFEDGQKYSESVVWNRTEHRKRQKTRILAEGEKDGADFITRIFGNIFGKAALEDRKPFGLQRMSDESMNELYPATTTEFADPVPTDDPEMALFRPLLAKTRLAALPLRLAASFLHMFHYSTFRQG